VTATIRQDIWIKSSDETTPNAIPDEAGPRLTGEVVGGPVQCDLPTGNGPKIVEFLLTAQDGFTTATLTQVDGNPLPTPVSATKVGPSKTALTVTFDGRAVCRFLKPRSSETRVGVGATETSTTALDAVFTLRLMKADGSTADAAIMVSAAPPAPKR